MRKVYFFALFLFISGGVGAQITQWTFEGVTVSGTSATFPTVTVGSTAADIGNQTAGSAFSALHATNSTWSTPVGNGSAKSLSANNWTMGDYFQFLFNTTGYNTISLTWDATGSDTGPRDYKVQYSTNGSVFTNATGTNSTYSMPTGITWNSTTPNTTSTRTLDLSTVTALNNNATVYIRLVVNSTTAINGGAVAAGGTSRVDNFTVNGNILSSNTITVDAVSALTFNIDCFTDGTGTVDFSSVGTFNAGNDYSAQLSDAAGSFASPTVIGTLTDNTANSGTINITIPAGTPSGVGYRIRVVSNDPVVISTNTSAAITISLTGTCVSLATDFYRSKNSGNWNLITTWQSSATGLAGTWINATLTPTNAANIIQIRNGHVVNVTAAVVVDQVQIESGALLNHTGGTITVEDGTGNDIDIQNAGVFRLALGSTPPGYGAGSPTINVSTGGILRVSAGDMMGAGTGVNVNNIIYQHQSILEWAPTGVGSFSTGGVTYFPNVDAVTIPIFRSSNTFSMQVGAGAGSNTIINGVFEAVNATVIWENAGTKTFRNGIKGSALIDGQNGTNPSGKFVINGVTAELGGSGLLVVPTIAGLEIGTPTTVTMTSDKTITGNISLLTDTYIDLGNHDLTVSGTVSNATITSYVRTLSTGTLTLQNVGSGASSKLFPIGRTTINPVLIGSTPAETFSARIVEPITPPIYNDNYAVLKTWLLSSAAATPPITNLTFGYTYPIDCGPLFVNTGANAQVGVNISGTWNIHQSGLTPVPFIIPGTSTVTPTNPFNSFTTGTEFPFVVANNGAILTIDCIITAQSKKINNTGFISWDVSSCSEVTSFEVQRSLGRGAFQTIGRVAPGTELTYNFTDRTLAGGTNLYRIKINGSSGAVKYSNTVAVINDTKGLLITALSPNPVTANATLVINAAKAATVSFTIFSISGQPIKQWQAPVTEGSNNISIATTGLPAGIYHLAAGSADAKTVMRFMKQ